MPKLSQSTRPGSNFLITPPPDTLSVSGEDYPIDSDFKTVLKFFELQRDERVLESHKGRITLKLFYTGFIPHDVDGAISRVAWFIRCGKEESPLPAPRRPDFDFAHDAPIIFSSFWEQYGLDLCEARLHWWKFSALFSGLGEQTTFRQVVALRNRKEDNLDSAAKMELREAKKAWALPLDSTTARKSDELTAALMAGNAGKLARILK